MPTASRDIEADGLVLTISNPDKVFFPEIGVTKYELAEYYSAVGAGVLRGVRDRPSTLKRFIDGTAGDFFFQKRVPTSRPAWLRTATVHFPSGRSAELVSLHDVAHILWAVNLGVIDLNPWPVRVDDLDHPDELRIDLDPGPGVAWDDVRRTALLVRDVLDDHGMVGFPKTSGSRGIHINVRVEPRWGFYELRRAALALGREVERRAPDLVTTRWWKEERHGVFIDYNQNARDRTVASVYSVRPVPDARVSCPLQWSEVADVEPGDLTLHTVPARFRDIGDPGAEIDERAYDLGPLLDLSRRDEEQGLGDAPWPPNFAKMPGEPKRVQPSRARPEGDASKAQRPRRRSPASGSSPPQPDGPESTDMPAD